MVFVVYIEVKPLFQMLFENGYGLLLTKPSTNYRINLLI